MSTNGTTTDKGRYQRYLASREWGLLKKHVKARSGGICERCKVNPSRAVHHLTYERVYDELLEDLLDVCEACHEYLGGHSDEDPCDHSESCEIPVTLTGIFQTSCWVFVFFHNDKHSDWLPDSELYIAEWGYCSEDLAKTLLGNDLQGRLHNGGISHRGLVGRKYKAVLNEDYKTIIKLSIDESRERTVDAIDFRHFFSVSTDHQIDVFY